MKIPYLATVLCRLGHAEVGNWESGGGEVVVIEFLE